MQFEFNITDAIEFIRSLYPNRSSVPLHAPYFDNSEEYHLLRCLRSTFVSSAGEYTELFENSLTELLKPNFVVLTVNGTTALQIALETVGVEAGDLVITQALSFVATANAIRHVGADPIFLDVDQKSMGLSPKSLKNFLQDNAKIVGNALIHCPSGRKISAVVPMHTLGHPCQIEKIKIIADEWSLPLVEDAAESLGSKFNDKLTGTFGTAACFSFNGNKIITSGGGGAIVFSNEELALSAKHLISTAKVPHSYDFFHDRVAYNYRMPSINAALGFSQLSKLDNFIHQKRKIAHQYKSYFSKINNVDFISEQPLAFSNFWLNAIKFNCSQQRIDFLDRTNRSKVQTRPVWKLLSDLPMYKNSITGKLRISKKIQKELVCLPSSVPIQIS